MTTDITTSGGTRYLPGFTPPRHIDTSRLVLRAWEPSHTPALKVLIDRNIEHLAPWIPWAWEFPKPLDEMFADVARFQREFDAGVAWIYGMFTNTDDRLIGGIGLHPRIGPGGVEIGYWLDEPATGHGYVTEATSALADLAFAHESVTHVEIRCDPRNLPSAAIPKRLGLELAYILKPQSGRDPTSSLQQSMVWRKVRPR